MAFRQLQHYDLNNMGVDPRVDSRWIVTSTHTVLAVSQYPTYNQLNDNGGISTLNLLGLIDSYNINENVHMMQTFEVGNKRSIIIPGKMRGQMSISSNIVESINVLGSIYETVLPGLNKYKQFSGKDLVGDILYTPELNKTYYSDPNKESEDNNATSIIPVPDTQEDPYLKLIDPDRVEMASAAMSQNDMISKGALLFSLDDLRLRVKFGLCFLIFQSSERVLKTDVFSGDMPSVDFKNVTSTEFLEMPMGDITKTINYKLVGGQYYENCVITDYNRSTNSQPVGPNINEGLSLYYNGTHKLKIDPKKEDIQAKSMMEGTNKAMSTLTEEQNKQIYANSLLIGH